MQTDVIALFATVLIALLGCTWKLGSMLAHVQSSVSDMARRVDKLEPLLHLSYRVERIEVELNELHLELRRTRTRNSPYPPHTKTIPGPL